LLQDTCNATASEEWCTLPLKGSLMFKKFVEANYVKINSLKFGDVKFELPTDHQQMSIQNL
jgi:hypothetical protein